MHKMWLKRCDGEKVGFTKFCQNWPHNSYDLWAEKMLRAWLYRLQKGEYKMGHICSDVLVDDNVEMLNVVGL